MTQQVDPRNPASAHPGQAEPPTAFAFESHTGSGTGTGTGTGTAARAGARTGSTSGSGSSGFGDRWPSLVNIRQVLTAFVLEAVSSSRPLREKLNIVVLRAWQQYLRYAQAYPLLTIFLSSLILLSAGPIVVFACITGVSLGILVGTAAVFVVVVQSIVVSIAGAILLFILGIVLFLTLFTFFWLVAGYMGFKFLREVAVVLHGQHQQHFQRQHQDGSGRSNAGAGTNRAEKTGLDGSAAGPGIGIGLGDSTVPDFIREK